jgi:hypothetical protein
MRALAGGQQFEAVTDELGRRWQVDGTEVREALAEQVVERHAEGGEDGYAEERLPVQGPRASGPLSVPPQLIAGVAPAANDNCRTMRHSLRAKQFTLLDPAGAGSSGLRTPVPDR